MRAHFGAAHFAAVVCGDDEKTKTRRLITPRCGHRGREKETNSVRAKAHGKNFHALDEKFARLEHLAADCVGDSDSGVV